MVRRFSAFLIDFFVVVAVLTPLVSLAPLTVEAFRTGTFVWAFERNYMVPSDWIIAISLFFVMLTLLMLYFALPIAKDRQTIGDYLMRLKVVPDQSAQVVDFGWRHAIRRAFLLCCIWPLLSLLVRRKDGTTWLDRRSNSRVHLIQYRM